MLGAFVLSFACQLNRRLYQATFSLVGRCSVKFRKIFPASGDPSDEKIDMSALSLRLVDEFATKDYRDDRARQDLHFQQ